MTRVCSRCEVEQPLEAFPKTGRPKPSNLGYEGVCKDCVTSKHTGETKRCQGCREWKPAEAYRLTSIGNRANFCIPCRSAYDTARKRGDRVVDGDVRRKLPPYEVLKDLVVNKRMTYQAIAEKYGVSSRRRVQATVRARAERRGEWPLLSPQEVERRRQQGRERGVAVGTGRIKSAVVTELLAEYLDENGVTRREFAERSGLRLDYLHKVLRSKPGAGMPPAYALRILEMIGEPIPIGLRERAKKGPQPGPVPTRAPAADVAACGPDAVADAERHVA